MACTNDINYQKELEKVISGLNGSNDKPRLLLHSCCAPCSSYCLVYLRQFFEITCFYYNPNITDEDEYIKRTNELVRLAKELNQDTIMIGRDEVNGQPIIVDGQEDYLHNVGMIRVIEGAYEPAIFTEAVIAGGLEKEPEGGRRCGMCFNIRLSKSLEIAVDGGFDYFTTSLTISPLKNAKLLNEIGMKLAAQSGNKVMWLPSDFKKKNGYKLSTQLSKRYDLYRQNYCGCEYSREEVKIL